MTQATEPEKHILDGVVAARGFAAEDDPHTVPVPADVSLLVVSSLVCHNDLVETQDVVLLEVAIEVFCHTERGLFDSSGGRQRGLATLSGGGPLEAVTVPCHLFWVNNLFVAAIVASYNSCRLC